jgi:hypothetical protein
MKRKTASKPRPVRAKSRGQRPARAPRTRRAAISAKQDDLIELLVAANAQALGLTIEPAWRGGVKFHLRLILDHAARVGELPLPDDAEPAPIFRA